MSFAPIGGTGAHTLIDSRSSEAIRIGCGVALRREHSVNSKPRMGATRVCVVRDIGLPTGAYAQL